MPTCCARCGRNCCGAIIAFDEAQFQLFVALGQPPTRAMADAGLSHVGEGDQEASR